MTDDLKTKIENLELAVKVLREERMSKFQVCDHMREELAFLLRELRKAENNDLLALNDVMKRKIFDKGETWALLNEESPVKVTMDSFTLTKVNYSFKDRPQVVFEMLIDDFVSIYVHLKGKG